MFFDKDNDETLEIEKLITEYHSNKSTEILQQIMGVFPQTLLFFNTLDAKIGPDKFLYINLKLYKDQNSIYLPKVAEKAIIDGAGITISDRSGRVVWVFSLGDLIPLVRRGFLINHLVNPNGTGGYQSKRITERTEVQIGLPSEDIIPNSVRIHLRKYMQTVLNINNPQFYLMYNPKDDPPWTMIFNFHVQDFRNKTDYQNSLASLSWFFSKAVFTGTLENDPNPFYDI